MNEDAVQCLRIVSGYMTIFAAGVMGTLIFTSIEVWGAVAVGMVVAEFGKLLSLRLARRWK